MTWLTTVTHAGHQSCLQMFKILKMEMILVTCDSVCLCLKYILTHLKCLRLSTGNSAEVDPQTKNTHQRNTLSFLQF